MIRISALNDSSSGSSDEEDLGPSREVLEAQAVKAYNAAITHLAHGNDELAEEHFRYVVVNPSIIKAGTGDDALNLETLPQEVALKYSCLKHLGQLATKKLKHKEALDYYMQAIRLDATEVTLWQRIGAAAIKEKDFELALVAFQEGLKVNPHHWPCLDQLMSVLFIEKMYIDVLGLAINALSRDANYTKALAFIEKIFQEQPSLRKDAQLFYSNSEILFNDVKFDQVQGNKFIETCVSLRLPNKVSKPAAVRPAQKLFTPLQTFDWQQLSQSLLDTYDKLLEADVLDFVDAIDMLDALQHPQQCKINDASLVTCHLTSQDLSFQETLVVDNCKGNKLDSNHEIDCEDVSSNKSNKRQRVELGNSDQEDVLHISKKRRSTTESDFSSAMGGSSTASEVETEVMIHESCADTDGMVGCEVGACKGDVLKESKVYKEKEPCSMDTMSVVISNACANIYLTDEKRSSDDYSEVANEKECHLDIAKTETVISSTQISSKQIELALQLENNIHEFIQKYDSDDMAICQTVNSEKLKSIVSKTLENIVNVENDLVMNVDAMHNPLLSEVGINAMQSYGGVFANFARTDFNGGVSDADEEFFSDGELDMFADNTSIGAKEVEDDNKELFDKNDTEIPNEGCILKDKHADKPEVFGLLEEKSMEDNRDVIHNEEGMDVQVKELFRKEIEQQNQTDSGKVVLNSNTVRDQNSLGLPEKNALATIVNPENETSTVGSNNHSVLLADAHDIVIGAIMTEENMDTKHLENGFPFTPATNLIEQEIAGKHEVSNEANAEISIGDNAGTELDEEIGGNDSLSQVDSSVKDEVTLDSSGHQFKHLDSVSLRETNLEDSMPEGKGRRMKRSGLERELEQLDYWGRKQQRDAKRCRRTITSRLVDSADQAADYLTWTDLIRSFIPASLLICTEDKNSEKSFVQPLSTTADSQSANTPTSAPEGSMQCSLYLNAANDCNVVKKAAISQVFTANDYDIDKVNGELSLVSNHNCGSLPVRMLDTYDANEIVAVNADEMEAMEASVELESSKDLKCTGSYPHDAQKGQDGTNKLEFTHVMNVEIQETPNTVENEDKLRSEIHSNNGMEEIVSKVATESEKVENFLKSMEKNYGILHVLQQLQITLVEEHKTIWSIHLAKLFTQIYPRVRKHVFHGMALKDDKERLHQDTLITLIHWELIVSLHLAERTIDCGTLSVSPLLEEDLSHLGLMMCRGDVWQDQGTQFCARVMRLRVQVALCQRDQEEAVAQLQMLLSSLDALSGDEADLIIESAKIECDTSAVSRMQICKQLNHMLRSQTLQEMVEQYYAGEFRMVGELLCETFDDVLPKSRPGVTLPSRDMFLVVLVDCLYQLDERKGVLDWGSRCLAEAVCSYNCADADDDKDIWSKAIMKLVDTIDASVAEDTAAIGFADRNRLSQLVSTLTQVLVLQVEKCQYLTLPRFGTLSPWILLHRILTFEEKLLQEVALKKAKFTNKSVEMTLEENNKLESSAVEDFVVQSGGNSSALNPTVCVSDMMEDHSSVLTLNSEVGNINTTCDKSVCNSVSQNIETIIGVQPSNDTALQSLDGNDMQMDLGISASSLDQEKVINVSREVENESLLEESKTVALFPSTMLLLKAHAELGRHSWCCCFEGQLMFFTLDVLIEELSRPLNETDRTTLSHALEQTSFCLYGHPYKKAKDKHKYIKDHNRQPLPLSLERALQLYRYYCPVELPDFQSCTIPSISDDVVAFFKRILALLTGNWEQSEQLEKIEDYINGNINKLSFDANAFPCPDITEMYYLLADHYFKNTDWENAIKYYKLDLTIEDRFESWAPLGLSVKAQLETQLNSCEVLRNAEPFSMDVKRSLRCLGRALELEPRHVNICVERGSLMYITQAYVARQLKQDLLPDMSLETFTWLEEWKGELLRGAMECFQRADQIQEEDGGDDEAWLYSYMQGKVGEKTGELPMKIIGLYVKARKHLLAIHGKLPGKINYGSPSDGSVVALEIYYRIHAYILKFCLQHEGVEMDAVVEKYFGNVLSEVVRNPMVLGCKAELISESQVTGQINSVQERKDSEMAVRQFLEEVIDNVFAKNDKLANINSQSALAVSTIDDDIAVVGEKKILDHHLLVSKCLEGLKLCLGSFSEHYKSLYRLSHYYYSSKCRKDISRARNYLLGCSYWQRSGYMPVNGLFHERKIVPAHPRNCNLFHGIWKIPNDEIDRPGNFAAHMYRSVSLLVDILLEMRDFSALLEVSMALKNTPEKDKKYLRENERELLCRHAKQACLQTMRDQAKVLVKGESQVHRNRRVSFLTEVYKVHKLIGRHMPENDGQTGKILTEAYATHKGIRFDAIQASLLKEAENFCSKILAVQKNQQILSTNTTGTLPEVGKIGSPLGNLLPGVQSRGRGMFPKRGRGRGRSTSMQGDVQIIQRAYELFNSLCVGHTASNTKLDSKTTLQYQQELIVLMQIPSVTKYFAHLSQKLPTIGHFFQQLMQNLAVQLGAVATQSGNQRSVSAPVTPAAHVPISSSSSSIPRGGVTHSPAFLSRQSLISTVPNSSKMASSVLNNSGSDEKKWSLSELASRSQAHGISIVFSGDKGATTLRPLENPKPVMSITVSSPKQNIPKSGASLYKTFPGKSKRQQPVGTMYKQTVGSRPQPNFGQHVASNVLPPSNKSSSMGRMSSAISTTCNSTAAGANMSTLDAQRLLPKSITVTAAARVAVRHPGKVIDNRYSVKDGVRSGVMNSGAISMKPQATRPGSSLKPFPTKAHFTQRSHVSTQQLKMMSEYCGHKTNTRQKEQSAVQYNLSVPSVSAKQISSLKTTLNSGQNSSSSDEVIILD